MHDTQVQVPRFPLRGSRLFPSIDLALFHLIGFLGEILEELVAFDPNGGLFKFITRLCCVPFSMTV